MSTFELIEQDIEAYCEEHSTPESDLLYKLNRQTHLETLNPRMLSGQLQGLFLRFIATMMRPRFILEVGTFTGYSSICLSEGLMPDGELHTLEMNVEYEDRIREYFAKADRRDQLHLHIGDAHELIKSLDYCWDLVFIDADKEDYTDYYEAVLPKVRKGGFILADNTLWNGKVTHEVAHNDKDTQAINDFNRHVQEDPRVRNLLLPFRDGIMMIEKL
ncbi:MAG: O-methyltransferase [Bacteroidales bacterium]|nr:O-methyltransferase [Bacteroidales bacterium]